MSELSQNRSFLRQPLLPHRQGPHRCPEPRVHNQHLQVDALERGGCYRVCTETASGARSDRPTLEQVLDQLRPSLSFR